MLARLGPGVLHIGRARARQGDRASEARRVARLRERVRHAHRRPRPVHRAHGVRRRDRGDPARHRRHSHLRAHTGRDRAGRRDDRRALGGRMVLGLGVSHRPVVEGWYGQKIEKPVREMREYLARPRDLPRRGPAGGREVADRLPLHGLRGARRPADLHRRPLPRDAAAGRRAGRRRDPVAVRARLHPRRRGAGGRRRAARRRASRSTDSTSSRRCRRRSPTTRTRRATPCAAT